MNGELIFALQRYNIFLEFATFRHIFLCGSVVVWKCVYLLCYFCVFLLILFAYMRYLLYLCNDLGYLKCCDSLD